MTHPNRAELLAAVERSPQAFAVHDRTAWVAVFTEDAQVEDPVGSQPHVGRDQIYRFYDTFIGPRDIKFHRDLDIVSGSAVLRDLELEVAMGPGATMYVPAFLRYDLTEVGQEWKVARLRAYWELPAMIGKFLRCGPSALTPGLKLSRGLLVNQGPRGTAGFLTGFRRVGRRQKALVETFLGAIGSGDEATAMRSLSSTATITLGDDERVDPAGLGERLGGARWTKVIGAGGTVAASVSTAHGRGLVFAEVARRGSEITAIRYFPA